MQSFTRLKPVPMLTPRDERADRDRDLMNTMEKGESWRSPYVQSWERLMGGRENFHHAREAPVNMKKLNTRSTYPFLTRFDEREPFERTQPMNDPGDASSYHHQQKQLMPSSTRIGSFWYDAAKPNIDADFARRRSLDSVWFASIRRTDHGQRLGNLRSMSTDTLDRPELFQGTPVYSNTICHGR
jgi:hypothetical protein